MSEDVGWGFLVGCFFCAVIAGLTWFGMSLHEQSIADTCGECDGTIAPGDICGPYVCTFSDGWK